MNIQRTFAMLFVAGSLAASAAIAADVPGGDFSRLSTQYADGPAASPMRTISSAACAAARRLRW
jgi:hypothetical protein